MEKEILDFWQERKIFEKSLDQTKGKKPFVFYDGPPFATGLPHYGHLLPGTVKDIIPRYWTMRGHYVERRFGWDCHGLPIEKLAQDELGLKGTPEILKTGVATFNDQCRSMVTKYVDAWRSTVARSGRWVDFDNNYKTMDKNFMESVWWVFRQIFDKGRVYRAYRVMPYSWALTTPLSNFEANSNYKDVQDPSVIVRFKLKGKSEYFLAWTTTPWTLPSNLGLCVGPAIDYVRIRDKAAGEIYILAEARLSAHYKKTEEYEILETMKGEQLRHTGYEPLFSYFKDQPNAFRVLVDPFVSTEDGTGVVHMAPAYGEDDYRICTMEKIELVDPLDAEAKFTSAVPDFAGQFCKEADKAIIRKLKDEGKLIHQSTIVHSYPFCDRSDTPLIYRAINAWYIRIEDLRESLMRNNAQIHWVPDYVGEKRFGNWLKEAKDWNFSRNRFWGSCIPIWECPVCSHLHCVGSIGELESLSGTKVQDLHKHHIDPITFGCTKKGCAGVMKRIPEVFDCWFESGAMPYGQSHYPFENKESFEAGFPADFIAESLDQTRGWFYTLLVLSTLLFDKPAIKNIVVSGLILAEDGKKMSKRLKNYPAPEYVMETHGADALRMYLIDSPVVRAEEMKFSENGIREILKTVIIPLWNAYNFFIEYAVTDHWEPAKGKAARSNNELDRWILSLQQSLIKEVNLQMQSYRLFKVVPAVVDFIENLTNWYIRRSRERFWANASENPTQKTECHSTLYTVLLTFSKIIAPVLPFLSEEMYRNLSKGFPEALESVHLCAYPEADESYIDVNLEKRMALLRGIVGLGNSLRAKHNLKNRQPLNQVIVVLPLQERNQVKPYAHLIEDELNVKRVLWVENEDDVVTLSVKPNFRTLGKKFGKEMKAAGSDIIALQKEAIRILEANGTLSIRGVAIQREDVLIERLPKAGTAFENQGGITVGLDTQITDDLLFEGYALEFKNRVNNFRKEIGLDKEDRVTIRFSTPSDRIREIVLTRYQEFLKGETLAVSIQENIPAGWVHKKETEVYGETVILAIEKVIT